MYQKFIFLLFIISINGNLFSQDNSIFYTHNEIEDTNINKLYFDLKSTSFLKNNEYFDTLQGWTGIGFLLQPKLVYQPGATTVVEAGYHLEKFSGRSDFYKPLPLFRIRQKLTNSIELVFGQLYGNLEHKLSEPMFRWDRYYSDNVEYGIQFLFENKYFTNDLWINWERFIFYNDPFKEEFVLGNVSNFKYKINENWKLNIPLHYTWTHAGGQIDKHDENRGAMMSLNNIMSGLEINYNTHLKILKSFKVSYSYYHYGTGANPPAGQKNHQLFDKGFGHYLKSNFDFGSIKLMLGYWHGHDYIARRGEYIFESIFEYFPEDYIRDKTLYTLKFIYDKKIKENIVFSIRSDVYYRPDKGSTIYSYAFYFVYNDAFLLKRIKKEY